MNIEIANRLLQLRKSHNFSQEALANQLHISRQAVSKWERAEASPDTDNLIELAKLYNISLDELLTGEKAKVEPPPESEPEPEGPEKASAQVTPEPDTKEQETEHADAAWQAWRDRFSYQAADVGKAESANGDFVEIGKNGIHVTSQSGNTVHVGKDGIQIQKGTGAVPPGEILGEGTDQYNWDKAYQQQRAYHFWYAFPYPVLALCGFLCCGFFCRGWRWSWLFFLTIPLYYTAITAVQRRQLSSFCYPIFAVVLFLALGLIGGLWHPGWIVFVTIPLFYWIADWQEKNTSSGA